MWTLFSDGLDWEPEQGSWQAMQGTGDRGRLWLDNHSGIQQGWDGKGIYDLD